MRFITKKDKKKTIIYSSVIIGLLVGISPLFVFRYTIMRLILISISVMFICLIDWGVLYVVQQLMPYPLTSKKRRRIIGMLLYYLLGVICINLLFGSLEQIPWYRHIVSHTVSGIFYRRTFCAFFFGTLVLLLHSTLRLIDEKQQMLMENEKLKHENLLARFETLKQQVNPHFLFNSLATLKSLIGTDSVKAEKFLLRLSDIFRYSLQTNKLEKVPLCDELKIMNAFFYMMKERFDKNLQVQINLDIDCESVFVPPFVLQMIAENCVKHNIISHQHPLTIIMHNIGDKKLSIVNTLHPKVTLETSSQIGLSNIDKRYMHLTGQHIEIRETADNFEVQIPLMK